MCIPECYWSTLEAVLLQQNARSGTSEYCEPLVGCTGTAEY